MTGCARRLVTVRTRRGEVTVAGFCCVVDDGWSLLVPSAACESTALAVATFGVAVGETVAVLLAAAFFAVADLLAVADLEAEAFFVAVAFAVLDVGLAVLGLTDAVGDAEAARRC